MSIYTCPKCRDFRGVPLVFNINTRAVIAAFWYILPVVAMGGLAFLIVPRTLARIGHGLRCPAGLSITDCVKFGIGAQGFIFALLAVIFLLLTAALEMTAYYVRVQQNYEHKTSAEQHIIDAKAKASARLAIITAAIAIIPVIVVIVLTH